MVCATGDDTGELLARAGAVALGTLETVLVVCELAWLTPVVAFAIACVGGAVAW